MALLAMTLYLLAQATTTPVPAEGKLAPALPTKASVEAEAKDQFTKMDTNRDGKVDRSEANAYHEAQLAARQDRRNRTSAAAFAKLDTDKDGMLSAKEFAAIAAPRIVPKESWFQANDIDGNGKVEINETVARVQRNFESIDTDQNGILSAEELQPIRKRPRL